MQDREVGRWACERCGNTIVAAGQREGSFPGVGMFTGPCPWECGAWVNRGFRKIRTGRVRAYRLEEWAARLPALPGWA